MHCPDICPTSLSQLAMLSREFNYANHNYVFISVDPKRDKLLPLRNYVESFAPDFVGVSGTNEELKMIAGGLGIQYKVTSTDKEILVAHYVTLSIINPNGILVGHFRCDFKVSEFVRSFTSHQIFNLR